MLPMCSRRPKLLPTERRRGGCGIGTRIRCLTLVLAFATALTAQDAESTAPAICGELTQRDDIDVLTLHGSLVEQGFAEGYLTAERIHDLFRHFALSDRVLPAPVLWSVLVVPRTAKRLELPPWVRPWCEAVLAGIEARDADLLEIPELKRELTVDDLVACAALPDFIGLACSSFVAFGEAVDGEGPVAARNLDYRSTPELLRHTMVIVRGPRDGRAGWVSIGWPGIAGCLTGVSERGVFAAIHDVRAKALPDLRITPRPIALQELIETLEPREAPPDEAAAILRRFRYGLGGNFMLAWRGRSAARAGAAVFEVWPAAELADGVTLRLPADGDDFVVCSNHHRARIEPEPECWRYAAIHDHLVREHRPFDLAAGLAVVQRAEVPGTLYQVAVDLGDSALALRLRRVPAEDRWDVAGNWKVEELLHAATPRDASAAGR